MSNLELLSQHKFDTSNYVILKDGVRRDIETGRLIHPDEQQTMKDFRDRVHPATSPLRCIDNALHELNLDRTDIEELPEGATVSSNVSSLRNIACALQRARDALAGGLNDAHR